MKRYTTILALFAILFLNACKKKTDDPQPSAGSRYLLENVFITDSTFAKIYASTYFSYDAEGRYEQIFHNDANGAVIGIESFHYNAAGLVSDYYVSNHNVLNLHYAFTYNADNLLTLRTSYSSPDFTTASSTLQYNYNADRTVSSYLYKDGTITDSVFFTGYTNGRPVAEQRYFTNNNVSSTTHYRYTYDGRMNRILTEQSMPNDINTFYAAEQNTFTPYSFKGLMGIPDINAVPTSISEDMNPSTRNKDRDLKVSSASGFNCGILNETTLKIEDQISGHPSQRIGTYYQTFNCGVPNGSPGLSSFSLYTYKKY